MKKIIKLTYCIFIIFALSFSLVSCGDIANAMADVFAEAYGGERTVDYNEVYKEEWNNIVSNFEVIAEELSTAFPESEEITVEENVQTKLANIEYEDVYTGDGECKGFARKIFYELFGTDAQVPSTNIKTDYEFEETANDGIDKAGALTDISQKTDDDIKELFSKARPGDIVQMRRSGGGPHTAIVVSVSDSGVIWCEANLDGHNRVDKNNSYTWAELRDGKKQNGKTFARGNEAMTIYTATNYELAE